MLSNWELSVDIAAPPDVVWGLVGDPHGTPRWYPKYVTVEVDGDIRTLRRADGGELVERVLHRDDERRTYTYGAIAGVPLAHHEGTFEVHEAPGGSRVVWRTTAEGSDPEVDMEARLVPTQREALQRMRALLEGEVSSG